jgi:hypothetical protein
LACDTKGGCTRGNKKGTSATPKSRKPAKRVRPSRNATEAAAASSSAASNAEAKDGGEIGRKPARVNDARSGPKKEVNPSGRHVAEEGGVSLDVGVAAAAAANADDVNCTAKVQVVKPAPCPRVPSMKAAPCPKQKITTSTSAETEGGVPVAAISKPKDGVGLAQRTASSVNDVVSHKKAIESLKGISNDDDGKKKRPTKGNAKPHRRLDFTKSCGLPSLGSGAIEFVDLGTCPACKWR